MGRRRRRGEGLLETHELILRGELRRTFLIARLEHVRVDGDDLHFAVGDEKFTLCLGTLQAERWATKIATPPPTLREKLGLSPATRALVVGRIEDPALAEALSGVRTKKAEEARVFVALVRDESELIKALQTHDGLPAKCPIWVVYEKGPKAAFGDTPVQSLMRHRGFMDNKCTTVSAQLSATRYARPIEKRVK